ncbi:hypothetical protein D3C71_1695210 [compost metagenome]
MRERVGEGAQVAQFQQFGHAAFDLVGGHALELQPQRHVLLDAEPRQQRVFLKDVAQGGRHLPVHDPAVYLDRARGGAQKARDHVQERALAAARGAHDGHEFARLDRQADLAHRMRRALAGLVRLADLVQRNHQRPRALRTKLMFTHLAYGTVLISSFENWRPSPIMAVMRL